MKIFLSVENHSFNDLLYKNYLCSCYSVTILSTKFGHFSSWSACNARKYVIFRMFAHTKNPLMMRHTKAFYKIVPCWNNAIPNSSTEITSFYKSIIRSNETLFIGLYSSLTFIFLLNCSFKLSVVNCI